MTSHHHVSSLLGSGWCLLSQHQKSDVADKIRFFQCTLHSSKIFIFSFFILLKGQAILSSILSEIFIKQLIEYFFCFRLKHHLFPKLKLLETLPTLMTMKRRLWEYHQQRNVPRSSVISKQRQLQPAPPLHICYISLLHKIIEPVEKTSTLLTFNNVSVKLSFSS